MRPFLSLALSALVACGGQVPAPEAAASAPARADDSTTVPVGASAEPKPDAAPLAPPREEPATTAPEVASAKPAPDAAPAGASAEPGASAGEYLPLRAGARYDYRATFRGRVTQKTIVVRRVDGGGEAAYYFIDAGEETKPGEAFFGPDYIGAGLYATRADGVYTADIAWRTHLKRANPALMRRMFATPLKVGAIARLAGHWAHRYTVEGFESVTVPAGTFERVARVGIKAGEAGADSESSTAWLAPGVGVVRWLRATGRVDELVAFHPPPK